MWISKQQINYWSDILHSSNKKNGITEAVHQLFIDCGKDCDPVRREFGKPMKLVRLIEMWLNEIRSRVRLGKTFI